MAKSSGRISTSITRSRTTLWDYLDLRHYTIILFLLLCVFAASQQTLKNERAQMLKEQNLILKYSLENDRRFVRAIIGLEGDKGSLLSHNLTEEEVWVIPTNDKIER